MGSPSLDVFSAFIGMTQNNLLWTRFKQGMDQRPLEALSSLRVSDSIFLKNLKIEMLVNGWNQCEGHAEIFYKGT